MRDLIGHPYDPTELLSPDPVSHGFDNIGESLIVSPFHVENFVKATDRLLDKVINIPDQPPLRQRWRILNSTGEKKPLLKDNGSWHDGHRGKNQDKIKPGFLEGNVLPNAEVPSGFTPYRMVDLAQEPPVEYEGSWDIRAFGGSQIDEGILIREGDNAFGFKWFAYEEGTYRIRIHLSTFGPGDWRGLPPKLGIVRYPEGTLWQEHLLDLNQSHTIAIDLFRDNIPWYRETNGNRHWGLKLYYQLTQEKGGDGNPVPFGLHISHIDVEGPYHPEWPPAWHRRVFPEQEADEQEEAYARRVLATFMKRALRRPAGEDEVAHMLEIYQKQRATGLSLKQALRMPLATILSSPSFLYCGARPASATPGHGAWELASRLSYFLWRAESGFQSKWRSEHAIRQALPRTKAQQDRQAVAHLPAVYRVVPAGLATNENRTTGQPVPQSPASPPAHPPASAPATSRNHAAPPHSPHRGGESERGSRARRESFQRNTPASPELAKNSCKFSRATRRGMAGGHRNDRPSLLPPGFSGGVSQGPFQGPFHRDRFLIEDRLDGRWG
jgi:hypothetical protein